MNLSSIVGLAAALVASNFIQSSPTGGLEPKQCLSIADMNAALKAEGQRTLVIGDREALNNDTTRSSGIRITRYANAVTSNADGSVGYQIEGDLPRAQSSTTMCVRARLANIHLLDARVPGVQAASLLGGGWDAEVREKEKIGTRPMVIADTVHHDADRSQRIGLPLILFGNIAGRSASIYARQADGRPAFMALIGDVDYTPYALQILDGRRAGN